MFRNTSVTSKKYLAFQKIDGIDVCLFSLYVQEFDENTPEPNRSRVNIAYLDSVDYFRPREMRTYVFHEILISYLKWSQERGFRQAHIWACPPQRGDNFIFWCHPPHQKTPSRDRLTSWYSTMLDRATSLNICANVDNLYNSFFSSYYKRDEVGPRSASRHSYVNRNHLPSFSAHQCSIDETNNSNNGEGGEILQAPICPPVFEGDMWVNDCSRAYRLVQVRSKSSEGQDRNLNQRKCREALKMLMAKSIAQAFLHPVNPIPLNIPDYFEVIGTPMDLGTVRDKLRQGYYPNMQNFAEVC